MFDGFKGNKTPDWLALASLSLKKGGIPQFKEIAPFKSTFIPNRRTKGLTGYVSQDPADEEYRCRFMGTKDIPIAWDRLPGTVQPKEVVGDGAEIMEL